MPYTSTDKVQRIGELSIDALQYAQELSTLDRASRARWLYAFGRRPISPSLCRRFTDSAAISTFLGLEPNGRSRRNLDQAYVEIHPSSMHRWAWQQWRAKGAPASWPDAASPVYKLYVSPVIETLDIVFPIVTGVVAADDNVKALKVGRGISGICRADKVILYFADVDALHTTAETLQSHLAGVDSQPVPYTASLHVTGLLSWGIDPPSSPESNSRRLSWREWVTGQLAGYLVAARQEDLTTLQPWQYALQRLSLCGVDPGRWVVDLSPWLQSLENE